KLFKEWDGIFGLLQLHQARIELRKGHGLCFDQLLAGSEMFDRRRTVTLLIRKDAQHSVAGAPLRTELRDSIRQRHSTIDAGVVFQFSSTFKGGEIVR